jgi:uncharacterized protein YqeY
MGLRDEISAGLKEALKAGDRKRLGTLRLMQAAIKDKDINSRTEGHDSAQPTSRAGGRNSRRASATRSR